MQKHQSGQYPLDSSLDPENALPDLVEKADVVRWEAALKGKLGQWMMDPQSPFDKIREELRGEQYKMLASQQFVKPPVLESPSVSSQSVFSLIVDLRSNGALPALLFNYDRAECEEIARELLGTLEAAEHQYRQNDQGWRTKLMQYQQWRDLKTSEKPKKTAKLLPGQTKADLEHEAANREVSKWSSFDPEAPLPQFNFADTTKLSKGEFDAVLEGLFPNDVKPEFVSALRRGVGVHHAGMNRRYRQM
jgi:hypothetical protein